MPQDSQPEVIRIRRALVQRFESMERAGLTHIKKSLVIRAKPPARQNSELTLLAKPTTAPIASRPATAPPPPLRTVSRAAAPNPQKADARLPSLVKIEQLEQSSDARLQALALVARDVLDCRRCGELATTRTQTVFGVGNPYAKLVFCGEAPGADEDRLGEPFVGRAGQLLTDIIEKGMKLRREDVYILNILRCRPPGNRNPLPVEAANCREFLERQLAIIQPQYICCLGAVAAQNLLKSDASIGRLRGVLHDLDGIKVLCTYHPAYLLRNPAAKKYVWDDIKILMAGMGLKM
jgi:uracil-DNA glycosylase